MKLKTIALATAFALTSTFALAQSSTGGSTSGGSAATGTSDSTSGPTGRPSGDAGMQKNMGTTGSSRPSAAGDASTSGAGIAAGPNNVGTSAEPGAVQSGTNKR